MTLRISLITRCIDYYKGNKPFNKKEHVVIKGWTYLSIWLLMKKSGKPKLVKYILHNYLFKVADMYHVMTHEGILSELQFIS